MSKRGRQQARAAEASRRAAERRARDQAPEQRSEPRQAGNPAARLTRGNNRWDALADVKREDELFRSVQRRRDRAIRRARSKGASWTELARILGVSPQAVQQKYGAPPAGDR